MPTYDYECEACGHELEAFHAMSADPLVECPECHEFKLIKLIGMGAAAIVKGTETPCRGNRGSQTQKKQCMNSNSKDRLGEGKNKHSEPPWWRKDKPKIDKDILKNPERYIRKGKID